MTRDAEFVAARLPGTVYRACFCVSVRFVAGGVCAFASHVRTNSFLGWTGRLIVSKSWDMNLDIA
jgi:hypothetical protein